LLVMDDYAEAVDTARALVETAVKELAELDAAGGDEAAYHHASALTEALRSATTAASSVRQLLVLRIRRRGNLSLAALADVIGVSKGRAQDIVSGGNSRKRAKTARRKDGDHALAPGDQPD
jgi:alkylhydroperoxidase family enzyme